MRSNLILLILGILLAFAGCETKAGQGTTLGAVGGGVVGHAIGGTTGLLIGATLGGLLGHHIGKEMDEQDRRNAAIALEQNRAMSWHNSQTGADYQIEPTGTSQRNGRECRDYRILAEVDGKPDEINGTACRRSDGSWEAMSG